MALRKRHILLIVALLLAFIGMATAAISILNDNVISPSESLDIDAYKISGIDVSAHNTAISTLQKPVRRAPNLFLSKPPKVLRSATAR